VEACLAALGARASGALSTSHQLVTAEAIPIPLVPAPSGGGVGWGRVWRHWERAPPARSVPATNSQQREPFRYRWLPPPAGAG
jgi:hypothetical protein